MTLRIIFTLSGFLLGWFIAIWGYIEGKEIKGGLKKNFRKYIKPQNKIFVLMYVLTAFVFSFIMGLEYNTVSGWLIIIISGILIHASIIDSISFQINSAPVIYPIIILIIIDSITWIFNINIGQDYIPSDKLLAGAVGAIVFFIIINITKKKGMGEGDLFVFVLMGLSLGLVNLIVAFYAMVLTGSIYGLMVGLKYKRFRGIKMPFVPFMTLGFVIASVLGDVIVRLYLNALMFN